MSEAPEDLAQATTPRLMSSFCTEAMMLTEPFLAWADRLRPIWDSEGTGRPTNRHRKLWEWIFILEALHERDMLRPGRRGLGFGVGQDPLAAVFASLGCEIVATDLDYQRAARAGWVETGQHASELAQLNASGLCDPDEFASRVTFRVVDMNRIPSDLSGFDFTWSACAFEHLGTLALGREFILDQMRCLRPQGVAVHTTEYNVSSNDDTVSSGPTVIFRRNDIDWMVDHLRAAGHRIDVNFELGESPADRHVDVPPWSDTHLKLQIEEYVATSVGLIVEKSGRRDPRRWEPAVRQARHNWARNETKIAEKKRSARLLLGRVKRKAAREGRTALARLKARRTT